MTEPKSGDLVAIYVRAEFHNQQEATGALAPKIYEVIKIEESVAVLLETDVKDIGKGIYDYSRGSGRSNETKMPIIVLSSTLHGHGGRQATSRRRSRRPAGIFVPSGSDREVAKASARQSSALTAARASLKVGARFGYQ